jgi:PEP-CTERM motif
MQRRKLQKAIRRLFAATLLSCGLICQQAGAAGLINGNITFAGGITLDAVSVGTATMVTGWDGLAPGDEPQVESVDGNFATFVTPGHGLEFHAPWSFNSGAIPSFWSVDGFTFDLISSAIPTGGQTANSVFVDGTGTISGHGFDSTPATFSFSTQDRSANGLFSFSGAASAVPEPATLMSFLSGSSLLGPFLFMRRRRT